MFTISMNLFHNNQKMIFRTEALEFPRCNGAATVSLPQRLFYLLIHLSKMVTTKKSAAVNSATKGVIQNRHLLFNFFPFM